MPRIRTLIIATLGPASAREAVLRRMFDAGLDAVRLNFSHGTHRDHVSRIQLVRRLNAKRRRAVRILQDLEGPRIRVGDLAEGPITLRRRQSVWLVRQGSAARAGVTIPLDYQGSLAPMANARTVFIDDGSIALEVRGAQRGRIRAEVMVGGVLKPHKGVNVPGVRLEFPALSPKDQADIRLGLEHGVDFIAQSFVRSRKEIKTVARLARAVPRPPRVIAKIEEREGIDNIDSILQVADGIMIARGDLGVSLPIWEVPMVQKELIERAHRRHKLAITATQMLESMTEAPRPTRAEVADVANAVLDGSDYLMLSGETAVGRHPAAAVDMMNRICAFTESRATGARTRRK